MSSNLVCSSCRGPNDRSSHRYCHGCAAAYMRRRRRGELPVRATVCTVAGCGEKQKARGFCSKHYLRFKRRGSTDERTRTIASKRYRLVVIRGHPLAHARTGRVYVHRAAMFDQIGLGPVPCFWCGRPLRWSTEHPQPDDALLIDHFDHDRHNNDPTNLRPSCNSCNCARSYWRAKPSLVPVYQVAGVGT